MSIKLVAVDMDGTFLDKQGKYDHERFHKLYGELKKRGIRFVVASGNPLNQLQGTFADRKDELTYISENGGYIVEETNELYVSKFPEQDRVSIINALREMPDVLCWVCSKNQSYTLDTISDHFFEMFLPYFPGVKKVHDFMSIEEEFIKFALFLPDQNVEERMNNFVDLVSDQVQVVDSGHYCVDLIPKHINKGVALQFLMDRYHISKDEIMAFGDAGNDEEMLKKVTYGYAMMNAKEAFKEKFNYIAPSNDEQGVFEVLETYLKEDVFMNLK